MRIRDKTGMFAKILILCLFFLFAVLNEFLLAVRNDKHISVSLSSPQESCIKNLIRIKAIKVKKKVASKLPIHYLSYCNSRDWQLMKLVAVPSI